jgi:hypothetical protein
MAMSTLCALQMMAQTFSSLVLMICRFEYGIGAHYMEKWLQEYWLVILKELHMFLLKATVDTWCLTEKINAQKFGTLGRSSAVSSSYRIAAQFYGLQNNGLFKSS